MWRLEARPAPSRVWVWASPVLALALTTLLGMLLFAALGKDPARGLQVFFWEPVRSVYALGELGLKAAPLLLMALGLALAFRSNVWNIGAEGQFVMGAVFAGGVALAADASAGGLTLPAMLLAGAAGGMCWAAIAALLRDKCHASEILVSLMLVYVAVQVLGYLVYGPWKDPQGYNFPQTRLFGPAAQLPRLMDGSRLHAGLPLALAGAALLWVWLFRTRAGLRRRRRAMRAFRRGARCGRPCWPRAARRGWPGRWRWQALCGSSRPTCRRAMALRPSSWLLWGGCIRWASCWRRC